MVNKIKINPILIPFEKSNKSGIALVMLILILFECLSKGTIIPQISTILGKLIVLLSNSEFYNDIVSSLVLTIKGILYSSIIATIISYLYTIPIFKYSVIFISKIRYLTLSGLIIVFTLIFPKGADFKIAIIIVSITPFFVTSLISMIDDINTELYDLCAVLKMSKWRTLYEVIIIGKLDYIIEVTRQNFAIAWLTISTAEGLNLSGGGLGTVILKSNRSFGIANTLAVLLVILIIGIGFDYLLSKLRIWLFPYAKLKRL